MITVFPSLVIPLMSMMFIGFAGAGCSVVILISMDAFGLDGFSELRGEWFEAEIDGLDRELSVLIPGHQSYADKCGIEVDLTKPPQSVLTQFAAGTNVAS